MFVPQSLRRHVGVATAPPRGGGRSAPGLPVRCAGGAGPPAERGPHPAGGLHADGRAAGAERRGAAARRASV